MNIEQLRKERDRLKNIREAKKLIQKMERERKEMEREIFLLKHPKFAKTAKITARGIDATKEKIKKAMKEKQAQAMKEKRKTKKIKEKPSVDFFKPSMDWGKI